MSCCDRWRIAGLVPDASPVPPVVLSALDPCRRRQGALLALAVAATLAPWNGLRPAIRR